MKFDHLVQSIADIHGQMQPRAVKAVTVGLTLRNSLIGAYISEYELLGEDRPVIAATTGSAGPQARIPVMALR